jgi:hypothetical protein
MERFCGNVLVLHPLNFFILLPEARHQALAILQRDLHTNAINIIVSCGENTQKTAHLYRLTDPSRKPDTQLPAAAPSALRLRAALALPRALGPDYEVARVVL